MQDTIIDWGGVAAGLTLTGLLDDSYLAVPVQGARAEKAPRAYIVARLTEARPALRHLFD